MNVYENYREICWKKWPNLQVSRIFDVFLSHGGSSRVCQTTMWFMKMITCHIMWPDQHFGCCWTTVLLPKAQGKLAENRDSLKRTYSLLDKCCSVYEFYLITRWFNMTCWFLTWRSLNVFKGHWSIPERSNPKNLPALNRVITWSFNTH